VPASTWHRTDPRLFACHLHDRDRPADVFKPSLAGGIERRIDSVGDREDVGEQVVAVANGLLRVLG
jgi:hypothetical protein